jgi:NAD(P)-dependent dehydrogenase (short-subunit alcohol dehydrogenase family)
VTWDLDGKVVLVTGASAGIGRAAALEFDRRGARVAMAARRRDRLDENSRKMTDALVLAVDLSDVDQTQRMVDETIEHYGRLDVLVNNAGETRIELTELLDLDEFYRLLKVNFVSAVVATSRAVLQMRLQGGGHIVNVTSPAALLGVPYNGTYSATKGAMCGWTRVLQSEWAGGGITATEYHPGLVTSEMGQAARFGPGVGALPPGVSSTKPSRWRRAMSPTLTPEQAGAHLVECVRQRRQIAYSTRRQAVLMHLSEIPRVRLALGRDRAQTMRQQLGIQPWSEDASCSRTATT